MAYRLCGGFWRRREIGMVNRLLLGETMAAYAVRTSNPTTGALRRTKRSSYRRNSDEQIETMQGRAQLYATTFIDDSSVPSARLDNCGKKRAR